MSARLQDELLDHPKLAAAGAQIGKNGRCLALGMYAALLMWTNKHLSNGVIPIEVLDGFRGFVVDPQALTDVLMSCGFLDKHARGFAIHDFADHNPTAATIRARRKYERERKRHHRTGNGRS